MGASCTKAKRDEDDDDLEIWARRVKDPERRSGVEQEDEHSQEQQCPSPTHDAAPLPAPRAGNSSSNGAFVTEEEPTAGVKRPAYRVLSDDPIAMAEQALEQVRMESDRRDATAKSRPKKSSPSSHFPPASPLSRDTPGTNHKVPQQVERSASPYQRFKQRNSGSQDTRRELQPTQPASSRTHRKLARAAEKSSTNSSRSGSASPKAARAAGRWRPSSKAKAKTAIRSLDDALFNVVLDGE